MIDYKHNQSGQNPEHRIRIKTRTYLPARDNSEIHGCFNVRIARHPELLTLIANNVTESLDGSGINRHFRANELVPLVDRLGESLVLTKPKAPVERLLWPSVTSWIGAKPWSGW
jgi:hypothetical protein